MTNFFNKEELCQLHVELTNACNAACPMCTRFHVNSPYIRPDLEIDQITLEKFKKYFPPEIIKKCEVILFCGVHGDPGMAKDLYEICCYINETNPKTCVRINTNGGMRKPEFWARMGELFGKNLDDHWSWLVTFSIDGLADTNHIYRRNVEWDALIANVKAYIDAGGRAEWDYLIFKHNEHQIDEAKELSKELGFYAFTPKKALGVDNGTQLVSMSALNKEGGFDYWIDAPDNPTNRNLPKPKGEKIQQYWTFRVEDYKAMRKNRSTHNNYQERVNTAYDILKSEDNSRLDSAEIKCKAKTMTGGKEIFVDNFGRVMPCCYIGTHLNGVHTDSQSLQLHYEMNKYGWDHFSLEKHSLADILDQGHLDKVFADTWTKPSCAEGKMAYCANICGTYSRVDRIYTHEKMDDKSRNWRLDLIKDKITPDDIVDE
jgi:MoaA/NifB/PqqE/SkfB family radical SAM enzyme